MKYLKKYENNKNILIEYILNNYLNQIYGFHDIIHKISNNEHIIKILFVNFDKDAANTMIELSYFFNIDWNLQIEKIKGDEKFYMVTNFEIDNEDMNNIINKIKLKLNTKKYNL